MPFRYIIEEKVNDLNKLFEKHQINLDNVYNGATFPDKENLFYEGKFGKVWLTFLINYKLYIIKILVYNCTWGF